MSDTPILMYLHGIGAGDPDAAWRVALDPALTALGYPNLSGVTVIAPKYANSLRGVDDEDDIPKVLVKDLRGAAKRQHRTDFERQRTAMEIRLGRDVPGDGWAVPDLAKEQLVKLAKQANHYVNKREVRAAVLQRVLRDLPTSGRIVIVGHSLGSVIAADVLRRLPPELEVVGMITLGSPLAHAGLEVEQLHDLLDQPPANLGWWVNYRHSMDPVTAGRGVSAVIPWVLERRLFGYNPLESHYSTTYLSSPDVASAIGYGLFGSRSTDLVIAEKGLDITLDPTESLAVLALRYGHLVVRELKGNKHDRYAEALRQVQASTFERLKAQSAASNRPLPSAIAQLAFDATDPTAEAPEPRLSSHLSIEDAIEPLVIIAQANTIAPFEIRIDDDDERKAMEALTLEMQLGRQLGSNVFEALDSAGDVLKGPTNWVKWAALSMGAAAVVAATGGLALVAAPGAAGAAAITSALAAFGPGGMIGGLLTAGTLMSAGGGGLVHGLAAPGTSAEAVEAVVELRLAATVLRDMHGIDDDGTVWHFLVDTEIEVARQLGYLEPVSGSSAQSVKQYKQKRDAIRRALDYLQREGFAPSV